MHGKYYVTQVTMAEFRQSGTDYSIPLEDLYKFFRPSFEQ